MGRNKRHAQRTPNPRRDSGSRRLEANTAEEHQKPERLAAPRPLYLREALESKLVDRVIVSTDDEEIASIAVRYGADVPFMRPAELAADKSPTVLCIEHALDELAAEGESYDCAVTLQPTNPLIR